MREAIICIVLNAIIGTVLSAIVMAAYVASLVIVW
jgi:hypothetical protein